jgi:hypothetical protein
MNDEAETLTIHTVYQDRLAKALVSPSHAAVLAPETGLILVEATSEDVTLAVLVDPATHIVRRVAYRGTLTRVHRGMLEVLCDIMIDRPMLECSDHAVICLEHEMRDPSRPRPVPGIITPGNADPAFRLPHTLVRDLAQAYWHAAGTSGGENFFDPPAAPAWRALTREERLEKVQRALIDICTDLQLSDAAIASVTVGGDNRVFLDLTVEMPNAVKGALLMTIEALLRVRVESQLHVYTVEQKDRNKIRRLANSNPGSQTTA